MNDLLDDLYIFEMANNHQGSVDHGLAIIDAAARLARETKIKAAVKLQFRDLDTFIHSDFKGKPGIAHVPRFESTRLEVDEFRQLVDAIRNGGLIPVATPFDEASVGTCLDLGVQVIKVASCSARDWPLLECIASARKPVIASTGGLGIFDIDNLVSFFRKRVPSFALMHCVSLYPTPNDQMALNFMEKMIRRYPYVRIGYSGHEAPDNTEVAVAAIAKGARLLERHVGVPTETVKLNGYSMNPDEMELWVQAAERARTICGPDQGKHVSQPELDSLLSLQRGVFARKPIRKGDEIAADDVFFAMPCEPGQLTSGDFGHLRATYTASRDYNVNESVYEKPAADQISQLRGILHDAKGLIFEAGIVLGDDYQIEISHHFGLESFRQTGCILVNLINREYAEKLLIVLPSQKHPLHHHKKKEETFRLLWGDCEVQLNDENIPLTPGDSVLVQRGDVHGFGSVGGAIIQEISTTHIVGDSYYEDRRIGDLDPMQRKTILESW
jgi:sialic acid synthase SpsE/mannose-6-phosphate isomerase-like protein (cupin superfamily)